MTFNLCACGNSERLKVPIHSDKGKATQINTNLQ